MRPLLLLTLWLCATADAQAGPGRFADHRPRLPAGLASATACAEVELSGDGRTDLVRAAGDEIVVLLQQPDGSFAPKPGQARLTFANRGAAAVLASGRFDRDADVDLVVGFSAGPDLLLANDGSGGFTPVLPSPLPGASLATQQIIVGDFDGRFTEDLVILAANAPPILLLSNGAGFDDRSAFLPPAARATRSHGAAADFDGDGALDLVLGGTSVAIPIALFNDGTANFLNGVVNLLPGAVSVQRIEVAHMNNDQDVDVVIGLSGPGPQAPVVIRNNAMRRFVVRPPGPFLVDDLRDLAVADVTGDGIGDLIALDGAGSVQLGVNQGSGRILAAQQLLGAAPRSTLCAPDIDGDGDRDVYVAGRGTEDSLLLGDGTGQFFDVEAATTRIGDAPGELVAIVDVTNEGDPDLVLVAPSDGTPTVYAQDGSGRFLTDSSAVMPAPPNDSAYSQIEVGSVTGGGRDLFLLGRPTVGNPEGIRVFVWAGQSYLDETAVRWPMQPGRLLTSFALAQRPSASSTDVIVGYADGTLRLFRATTGVYGEVAGAFPSPPASAIQQILVGELTGDRFDDVVVLPSLASPVLYRGVDGSTFQVVPNALQSLFPSTRGAIADVDGDGRRDVLFATPGRPEGVTFMQNIALGRFVDATPTWLGGAQIPGAVDIAVSTSPGLAVVVGRGDGADVSLAWQGPAFAAPEHIGVRGAQATIRLRIADLDFDGDDDLVVARANSGPAVLFGQELQLSQVGDGRIGADSSLRITGMPGRLAFLLFSPVTVRNPVPPYGILRLLNPLTLTAVSIPASGRIDVGLPVSSSLRPRGVPFQVGALDAAAQSVQIGNLEFLHVSDF